MNHPRTNVAGVIIRDNHILLVEYENDKGIHYNFPGGGVDLNETLHEALKREVLEETCAVVTVGRLLAIWEYIPPNDDPYGNVHKIGHLFNCKIADDCDPRIPDILDRFQIGIRWIPLDELMHIQLYPDLGDNIGRVIRGELTDIFYGKV